MLGLMSPIGAFEELLLNLVSITSGFHLLCLAWSPQDMRDALVLVVATHRWQKANRLKPGMCAMMSPADIPDVALCSSSPVQPRAPLMTSLSLVLSSVEN